MTNLLILTIQIASIAFLAWGGLLSLRCVVEDWKMKFTGFELDVEFAIRGM